MRETLYVWPVLPIAIMIFVMGDNIVAALEQNDRICELASHELTSSEFEKVLAATQQPFPALTHLRLWLREETTPVVPDSFLGGSALVSDPAILCPFGSRIGV